MMEEIISSLFKHDTTEHIPYQQKQGCTKLTHDEFHEYIANYFFRREFKLCYGNISTIRQARKVLARGRQAYRNTHALRAKGAKSFKQCLACSCLLCNEMTAKAKNVLHFILVSRLQESTLYWVFIWNIQQTCMFQE